MLAGYHVQCAEFLFEMMLLFTVAGESQRIMLLGLANLKRMICCPAGTLVPGHSDGNPCSSLYVIDEAGTACYCERAVHGRSALSGDHGHDPTHELSSREVATVLPPRHPWRKEIFIFSVLEARKRAERTRKASVSQHKIDGQN